MLAETIDLGQGRRLLEPSAEVTLGQEMELEFHIPSLGGPLLIHAKAVRFEQPSRIAVQFLDATDGGFKAVQSYIAQRVQM